MDSDRICTVEALEANVGKVPGSRDLKVMDYLDASAIRWLETCPLLFAAFGDGITIGGGTAGFVRVVDSRLLEIPLALLDAPQLPQAGQAFGSLLLSPGLCETLRVNGTVKSVQEDCIRITVRECYLHCAKALMRSDFWKALPDVSAPSTPEDFLAASRFIALATVDAAGNADVSPKGDPAGTMLRMQQGDVWYADRPGNRRVDSFRNILQRPRVAAIALIPGSCQTVLLSGGASISTDASMCAAFTVAGKVPKLVTRVERPATQLQDSAALTRARLWPAAEPAADIDPAAMFVAHVRNSKAAGLQATLARTALQVPGVMEKGLELDYKNRLY